MSKSFIEGKWYLYKHPEEDFYLRSCKNSTDRIHYSEWIAPRKGNYKHNYGEGSYENSYTTDQEVPIIKVKKFLPAGHPDLEIESVIKDTQYLIEILKQFNIK